MHIIVIFTGVSEFALPARSNTYWRTCMETGRLYDYRCEKNPFCLTFGIRDHSSDVTLAWWCSKSPTFRTNYIDHTPTHPTPSPRERNGGMLGGLMNLTASLLTTGRLQQCNNVMWISCIKNVFVPVSLLYSVGNKTYYYYNYNNNNYYYFHFPSQCVNNSTSVYVP